ncbi:MAG: hypothetical protein IJB45_08240, partial [Clostridia bacterium]|nr:hypothetical protein [Clostridia bacterium]
MEILVLSSLEKVLHTKIPSAEELKAFSMLKNEKSSFQIAFYMQSENKLELKLSGELAQYAKPYTVKHVPVRTSCNIKNADDFFIDKAAGNYPDYLEPIDGFFTAEGKMWHSIWIEIVPNGEFWGKSTLEISLGNPDALIPDCYETKKIEIEVINAELPKQSLIHTCWYHSDCLCNFYGFEALSDDFWQTNERFIKTAVEHGINCILTPLFTPPLDTKVGGERRTVQLVKVYKNGGRYRFDFRNLQKWIDMCKRCNVEYIEFSHLFTQWGAKHAPKIIVIDSKGREKKLFGWETKATGRKYTEFLRAFASELIDFIDKNGIRNKCFIHISDEPSERDLKTYRKHADLFAEIFPGFATFDALSDYEFYKTGAVKLPVPCESDIEDFAGNVPELWTYYCCGQDDDYLPNRFIAMPSLRNRILGFLMYKYNIKGFLQW